MADFQMNMSSGGVLATWTDTLVVPSRINPNPEHPHKYWTVQESAGPIRFSCTVNGVFEPSDLSLGGRLFIWSWVEQYSKPAVGPIAIPSSPPLTSVAEFPAGTFVGAQGHHLLMAWRPQGGAVAIPFLVIP